MPFSLDNQCWKHRKQQGPRRKFETAEHLLSAAEAYFDWSDQHPLIKIKVCHHTGKLLEIPVPRPFSIIGLCLFLQVNSAYWRQLRRSKDLDEDYQWAIERIDSIIYVQKFQGAVCGIFNANLISRDLGLGKKAEVRAATSILVRRDEASGDVILETMEAA